MKAILKGETSTAGLSCPYAVALHPDEVSDTEEAGGGGQPHPQQHVVPAVEKCPAFQQGSCPFKNAKSAEEVRQTLLQMPPSHFDPAGKFYQVVQELHAVTPKIQADSPESSLYHLPGGCPLLPLVQSAELSFTEALEHMSLAAIMAKAMEKREADLEQKEKLQQAMEALAGASTDAATSDALKTEPADSSSLQVELADNAAKDTTSSLSESLKTGTAVSHQAAEDVHFVKNFIKGKIERTLYKELVLMLYQVYNVLEDCLDQYAGTHFPTCHFPDQLRRTPSLLEDLDFWFSEKERNERVNVMSPATRDYVERLKHISKTDPLMLLAHSYTRYLGDLSGGLILARVARKAMNLGKGKTGCGLDFYHFEHVDSPKLFKDSYRHALDALPLTAEQINKLVGEANVAFCLNMRLFEELDVQANVPGAKVRPLHEALKFADPQNDTTANASKAAECPFAVVKSTGNKSSVIKEGGVIVSEKKAGQCPWPFIFMHDPVQGMGQWQSWVVLGLILCFAWQSMLAKQNTPTAV